MYHTERYQTKLTAWKLLVSYWALRYWNASNSTVWPGMLLFPSLAGRQIAVAGRTNQQKQRKVTVSWHRPKYRFITFPAALKNANQASRRRVFGGGNERWAASPPLRRETTTSLLGTWRQRCIVNIPRGLSGLINTFCLQHDFLCGSGLFAKNKAVL